MPAPTKMEYDLNKILCLGLKTQLKVKLKNKKLKPIEVKFIILGVDGQIDSPYMHSEKYIAAAIKHYNVIFVIPCAIPTANTKNFHQQTQWYRYHNKVCMHYIINGCWGRFYVMDHIAIGIDQPRFFEETVDNILGYIKRIRSGKMPNRFVEGQTPGGYPRDPVTTHIIKHAKLYEFRTQDSKGVYQKAPPTNTDINKATSKFQTL